MNESGLNEVTESSYYEVNNFNFYMMDIVRMWISGYSFSEISTTFEKIFDGNIIRGFKRLEEILRQLASAANVIGNQELVNLFSQGIFLIKKDIVFANSLYL
ncbi:SK2L2 [Hepatospora eriocheir]|nr:SK2L2 [Hepatospora eriocheir]